MNKAQEELLIQTANGVERLLKHFADMPGPFTESAYYTAARAQQLNAYSIGAIQEAAKHIEKAKSDLEDYNAGIEYNEHGY